MTTPANDLSMKLLMMFDVLYRTGHVSKAAAQLGVSQPTLSAGLGKLRKQLNDPLFVRIGSRMEPTARAQQLAQPLRHAMELMRAATLHQAVFDVDSPTRFHVCMTDTTQLAILPRLLERFRAQAPLVEIEVIRYGSDTLRQLAAGEIDLLVGNIAEVGVGFYEQTLLKRDFVCLVSAQHPRVRERLSAKQFSQEAQVIVRSDASGLRAAERAIEALRIRRDIKVVVPDFLSIESIISSSEMIATVPRGVAQMLSRRGRVKWVEHPLKLPTYPVKQHWHERYHLDSRNQWLRRMVADVFAGDVLGAVRL